MRPDFVYFDLGNVLCFFDHQRSVENMVAITGSDSTTIRNIVYVADLEHRYETGLISGKEFVNEISQSLKIPSLDCDAMLIAASDMFRPNDEILAVLNRIESMGIPIGILSNTCDAHWQWIVNQNYPQLRFRFDPIVLSYEEKVMKPDREIYRLSTEKCGFEAHKIFFTDDRIDNIDAAKQFGWSTHAFVDVANLMTTIDQWE